MDNNFEELLRKAIEASNASGDTDGDDMVPEEMKQMLSILETGSLIKLGKSAKEKMGEVIKDLIDDLTEACKSQDPAGFYAHAVNKIDRAARTLKILHLIISASVLSGSAALDQSKDADDVLNLIINLNTL